MNTNHDAPTCNPARLGQFWMSVIALVSLLLMPVGCTSTGDSALGTGDTGSAGRFQVYGNWCGPGHPKEGARPRAINAVDAACQSHDQCYANNGYLNRVCDNRLIDQLSSVRGADPLEEAARQAIIAYFERSPKVD